MDAEGGRRAKHASSAGRDELVAQILVERDAKKLEVEGGRGVIIGIGIAHKG